MTQYTFPLSRIYYTEDDRQRQQVDQSRIQELADSISSIGLINPPVIESDGRLIAGYMRVNAMTQLGWEETPVTLFEQLSEDERKVVELEENIKRQNLSWQDISQAVLELHERWAQEDPEWGPTRTGEQLSMSSSWASVYIRVGQQLRKGNDRVWKASSLKAARNIVERIQERAVESELDSLKEAEDEAVPEASPKAVVLNEEGDEIPAPVDDTPRTPSEIRDPAQDLQVDDFLTWAENYSGSRFNTLHCDFPYGIGHGESDQGRVSEWESYDDSQELFWKLCYAIRDNLDNFLLPSAHIVFWFSMNYYEEVRKFLEIDCGFDVDPHPLVWHKTGGSGILPDPSRTPRRIYETAFFCSRGDRKILSAMPNLYSCPKRKEKHVSEKPENMLKEFFRMFVDEYSTVLDPTCGSGNALLAAENLGSPRVYGLDISEENIEIARASLTKTRKLNAAKGHS